MIVYEATKGEFCQAVLDQTIAEDIYEMFQEKLGRRTSESEIRSWENSMEYMDKVLNDTEIPDEVSDELCDKCGKPMVVKRGRFGKFLACSGYPECKTTKKITIKTAGICPNCGSKIVQKKSTKGRLFYGCENYPDCNFMSWDEPTNKKCEKCGNTMFIKKSKQKTIYCIKCDK